MEKNHRFIVYILFLVLPVLMLAINVKAESGTLYGDVNNDGKIALNDFNMLRGYILKSADFAGNNAIAADVNRDGAINSLDLSYLKMYLLSRIDSFPSKGHEALPKYQDNVNYFVSTDDPSNSAIEITNTSNEALYFSVYMNGKSLFQTENEVLSEIRSMPDEITNEPIERKIWRFIRDNRFHWIPFTGDRWGHSPVLMFNSIGFGFCDDCAAIFCRLAGAAGLQARVWGLDNKHVVPEVFVSGRWEMYDPDYGVYFKNKSGLVAGVEELGSDGTLITSSVERMKITNPLYNAYTDYYAALFASSNKDIYSWYDTYIDISDWQFNLVPGSKIDIGENEKAPIDMEGNVVPDSVYPCPYSHLKITVPGGNNGTVINPPLVLQEVKGEGRFEVELMDDNKNVTKRIFSTFELNNFNNNLNGQNRPYFIKSVKIISSESNVEFVYLLNPVRYSVKDSNTITLKGKGVDGITAAIVPKSS